MTNEEAIRILHCPSMYVTDEDGEMAHIVPMFSKAYGEALAVAFKALEQQPCEDCISRQAVLETIKWYEENTYDYYNRLIESIQMIEAVTPANVYVKGYKDAMEIHEKLKVEHKGKWIKSTNTLTQFEFECSVCGFGTDRYYKYCANCGADMEVKK